MDASAAAGEVGLPFIDEHAHELAVPGEGWSAVLGFLGRQPRRGGLLARALGCNPLLGSDAFSGQVGEAITGFRVAAVTPGRQLTLVGRHRFARYSLTFLVDERSLRAQTHADFPGLRGRLYRAVVIGSGIHRLVTRAAVRHIARTASVATPGR